MEGSQFWYSLITALIFVSLYSCLTDRKPRPALSFDSIVTLRQWSSVGVFIHSRKWPFSPLCQSLSAMWQTSAGSKLLVVTRMASERGLDQIADSRLCRWTFAAWWTFQIDPALRLSTAAVWSSLRSAASRIWDSLPRGTLYFLGFQCIALLLDLCLTSEEEYTLGSSICQRWVTFVPIGLDRRLDLNTR